MDWKLQQVDVKDRCRGDTMNQSCPFHLQIPSFYKVRACKGDHPWQAIGMQIYCNVIWSRLDLASRIQLRQLSVINLPLSTVTPLSNKLASVYMCVDFIPLYRSHGARKRFYDASASINGQHAGIPFQILISHFTTCHKITLNLWRPRLPMCQEVCRWVVETHIGRVEFASRYDGYNRLWIMIANEP